MNYKILFTDTAKSDLRQIALYIADQSKDKNIAIRFVNELREKTKILETFPESGAFPKDYILRSADYRFLVHKEYMIFYRFDKEEKTSYVLAIFNSKRDYMRVMKQFI